MPYSLHAVVEVDVEHDCSDDDQAETRRSSVELLLKEAKEEGSDTMRRQRSTSIAMHSG